MPSKFLSFAAASRVTYRSRSNASPYGTAARFEGSIRVDSIEREDAPVALEMRKADGLRVQWRQYDGALWRPLLREDGTTLALSVDELGKGLRAASQNDFENVFGKRWMDNPFGSDPRGQAWGLGIGAYLGHPREEFDDRKIVQDSTVAAREHLLSMAGRDLLEIGGVVHRRSTQPAWGYGGSGAYMPYNLGAVELVIPDYGLGRNTPCLFGLEDRDVAYRAASDFHARMVEAIDGQGPAEHVKPPELEDDAIEQFGDLPAFDPLAKGLDAGAWSLMDEMEEMSFRSAGYETMRVAFKMIEACRVGHLLDGSPDLEMAAEAGQQALMLVAQHQAWPRLANALALAAVAGDRARLELEMFAGLDDRGLRI